MNPINKERQLCVFVKDIPRLGDIRAFVNGQPHSILGVGENNCLFKSFVFKFNVSIDNLVPTRIGVFGECKNSNEVLVSNHVKSIFVSISDDNVPIVTTLTNIKIGNNN